jgi:hypothetical protein
MEWLLFWLALFVHLVITNNYNMIFNNTKLLIQISHYKLNESQDHEKCL